jgi:hypothetical protein
LTLSLNDSCGSFCVELIGEFLGVHIRLLSFEDMATSPALAVRARELFGFRMASVGRPRSCASCVRPPEFTFGFPAQRRQ